MVRTKRNRKDDCGQTIVINNVAILRYIKLVLRLYYIGSFSEKKMRG